jgi:hypothetical protein
MGIPGIDFLLTALINVHYGPLDGQSKLSLNIYSGVAPAAYKLFAFTRRFLRIGDFSFSGVDYRATGKLPGS